MGPEVPVVPIGAKIPATWAWQRLDSVCEGIFDCPHSTPNLTDIGPFIVRTQDIRTGIFRTNQAARVSEETYHERTSRAEPRTGDLLFSREGTYFGHAAEVPNGVRVCLGQRMVLIRPNSSTIDSTFLRFWINSPLMASHVAGFRDGSVAERLNLPTIRALPVGVPSLAEQRAIARILGALDDKIELNRKMNETLEAMARALFKSWFVDFDPVRAKAQGRPPRGMDAETARLFPSEFVESELGPIPKGWRAAAVADCVTLKRGTTYKGMLVGEPGPALLGLGSIRPGGGFRSNGFKTYGGDCPPELMLRPGELYVSLKGATKDGEMIGSVARVPKTVSLGRLTQDTVKLEIRNRCLPRFLYRLLLTPEYRTYCANRAMGSAVVALSREDFLSYPFTLPDTLVLERFDTLLGGIEDRAEQNDAENVELAKTRDYLLPRLLSGELSVAAAERAVEQVA